MNNFLFPCDYHLHSYFSGDSETPVEDIITKAIALGMKQICLTDHLDFDYMPDNPHLFELDSEKYYSELSNIREKYKDKIKLCIGIETGLEPDKSERLNEFIEKHPFDFIIGSSHLVNKKDPYYPEFFHDRTDFEAFNEYFDSIIKNLNKCNNFDVYGHIDYVVRYSPNKNKYFTYLDYKSIIDEILNKLISMEKGIEINTGGYRSGLNTTNPCKEIIMRYRELGGEIITIGSDAHTPDYIGSHFYDAVSILKECGFSYYTIFENRKPCFIKL